MYQHNFLITRCFTVNEVPSQYPAGTELIYDSFEGGGAVNPASHTPNVGEAWAGPDSNNGKLKIATISQDLRNPTNDASTLIYQPTNIVVANYGVLLQSRGESSGTSFIRARYNTATNDYYYLTIDGGGGWVYGYALAGVQTALGSGTRSPYLDGIPYNTELRCVGSTISVWFDSTQAASTTDSHVSSAGKAGCGLGGSVCRSNTFKVIAR